MYHFKQLYLNNCIPTVQSYNWSHLTSTLTISKHIYLYPPIKTTHAIKKKKVREEEVSHITNQNSCINRQQLPLKIKNKTKQF